MYLDFQRLMQDATQLTRAGHLDAATAAILAALSGQPAAQPGNGQPPGNDPSVIDVEARVVPDAGAPGRAQLAPGPQAKPQPGATTGEQFLAGSYGRGLAARDYKLYVPPGAGTRPMPLVVMLHGCTQDPDDFAAGTAMNDAAREQGFFVLYPAQSGKANPQRCWNWFKHSHQARGRGEPAALAGMTKDVMARHGIDPSRVYVAGLSAGGAMAAILAQAYPDLFAAYGVHSGLPVGAARDLSSALQAMKGATSRPASGAAATVPSIVFHGDADTTVHPDNGEQIFGAAGQGTAQTESGREAGGRSWTRRVRVDANGRPVAEHWQVHGSPHAWSGGRSSGSYTDPNGPNATAAMLRFFLQHSNGRRG